MRFSSLRVNTGIFTMSLCNNIQKITQIHGNCENSLHAEFILRQDNNTSKRNQKMRRCKAPKNADLYDNGDEEDYHAQNSNSITQEQCYLPESEIASSIKEASGGIDYSNENLEEHWRFRQTQASLNSHDTSLKKNSSLVNNCYDRKNSAVESNVNSSLSEIKIDEKNDTEDEESILRKCRLNKNAAIRGLLKTKMITTEDLEIPVSSTDATHDSSIDVQSNLREVDCMKLVQHPEDPDVFMQPLQALEGIDESKYKDIDFSVPHMGKKEVVTPSQFYLNMDDSDFNFVRKGPKEKK